MDRLPYDIPSRWWPPNLRPLFIRVLRPLRVFWRQKHRERVVAVTVRGLRHLRQALDQGCGVVITPKHAGHADAFVLLAASDQLGRSFYYMVAWQVLQLLSPLGRWVLQRHGCFSVDRESYDVRAFRQAVDIVRSSAHPLVIFPEGEIYHNSLCTSLFRSGAAAVALAAARRCCRPVVCVPAAIHYQFMADPMPYLHRLMDRLEQRLCWQPRPDIPLTQRVQRFAQGLLCLREEQYLGQVQCGSFACRIDDLTDAILGRLEKRHGVYSKAADVPGRVSQLRHRLIRHKARLPADHPQHVQCMRELEDLQVVVQLFSYANDFACEWKSPERLAEILDKYEEDVLEAPTATVHTPRRATIIFGPPVEVLPGRNKKENIRALTELLQSQVQGLVDQLHGVFGRAPADMVLSP